MAWCPDSLPSSLWRHWGRHWKSLTHRLHPTTSRGELGEGRGHAQGSSVCQPTASPGSELGTHSTAEVVTTGTEVRTAPLATRRGADSGALSGQGPLLPWGKRRATHVAPVELWLQMGSYCAVQVGRRSKNSRALRWLPEVTTGSALCGKIKKVNSAHPDRPWGLSKDGAIQRTNMAGSSLGALRSVWRGMWVP